jgi:hypothetical protein
MLVQWPEAGGAGSRQEGMNEGIIACHRFLVGREEGFELAIPQEFVAFRRIPE